MAKLGQYNPIKMTAQEVFEVAANHLLEQGKRSLSDDLEFDCVYKGPNSTCCAAGPFIQRYDPCMEGRCYQALVDEFDQPGEHLELIIDLQSVHDHSNPSEWPDNLSKLAERKGLCAKFLAKWR